MASYAQPVTDRSEASPRLWRWLIAELVPPPGIYPKLARIVVTTVITFIIVATFQMPYAAITLYSVFTIDRSSRRAALLRAIESIVAVSIGVVIALAGIMLVAQLPLLTFVYYAAELFLVAFLIRTTRLQGPAMNMGMAVYSVHNVWQQPYPAGVHMEQTLWVWLTLCLGFAVSVGVEFAFVRENPFGQIVAGLSGRLRALTSLYSDIASDSLKRISASEAVLAYADKGTASIRNLVVLLRSTDPQLHEQLLAVNTMSALVARLVDISATIDPNVIPTDEDRVRLNVLAAELSRVTEALQQTGIVTPANYETTEQPSDAIPLLPELERTTAMIPTAFAASENQADPAVQMLATEEHLRVFIPDAFTNPAYKLFALKTMFAAILCYVTYSAFAWQGISTSVVTCLVTALNTGGATKQKQLLRLTGATAGGLIALGALVFLLPEMNSITSVTLLVAAVSAFSAWFALVSPRVSYFGMQTALAFYLALIQNYSASTELAPARDRALGVLLGLAMMWLVFDNLWPISAASEMKTGFAANLRLLAQLITTLDNPDRIAAIRTIRSLRDRIQSGFAAVHSNADSVLFEFGSRDRQRHLALRDLILRLQATLRSLFVVEIAICQYRTQVVPGTRPPEVRDAQRQFDDEFATTLEETAAAVDNGQPVNVRTGLAQELERLRAVVMPWDRSLTDRWVRTRIAGIQELLGQAVRLASDLVRNASDPDLHA